MSQQNVEVVQGVYKAIAAGNVPGVLGAMSPEIVWNEAEGFLYADGNPYIGPNAILNGVFLRLATEWDHFKAVPTEFLDAGDTVIAIGRYTGTFKATGKPFDAPFAHFWTLSGGKTTKFQQYTDTLQSSRVTTA